MEKLNEIIQKITASVQVVLDGTLNLAFQPLFYLLAIIEGIIEVWTATPDNEEYEEQPQVTQLPSTNTDRYPEEVEYPIGFRQNRMK